MPFESLTADKSRMQHEMTGHVLLTIHNHLVLTSFLSAIRSSILDGSFPSRYARFLARYATAPAGEYPCLVSARATCAKVDEERGRGRDKRKAATGEVKEGQAVVVEELESMSLADQDAALAKGARDA